MGKLFWTLPETGGGIPYLNSFKPGNVLFQTAAGELPGSGCLSTQLMWKAEVFCNDFKIPSLHFLCAMRSGVKVAPLLGWKATPGGWERSAGPVCGVFTWSHPLPPQLGRRATGPRGCGSAVGRGLPSAACAYWGWENPSYKQDINMALSVERSSLRVHTFKGCGQRVNYLWAICFIQWVIHISNATVYFSPWPFG